MTEKKRHLYIIFLLLIVIIAGNYFLRERNFQSPVEHSGCQLTISSCDMSVSGKKIELSIEGEVKALQPFILRISDKNHAIDRAVAVFRMKGMDMGKNEYAFVNIDAQNWIAEVVIPLCTVGRRDWSIELELYQGDVKKKLSFDIKI